MSRLMQRLRGRVYAWFDHVEPIRLPRLRPSLRPQLHRLEDRVTPATFTVFNTFDTGPGSLRQAMLDANTSVGADIIQFNTTPANGIDFSTTRNIITPISALPDLIETVTLNGPGADRLWLLSNYNGFRGLNFNPATNGNTFNLSGITISSFGTTAATAVTGAGLSVTSQNNLNLNGVTITGNRSGTGSGAGLSLGNGTHTITNCTFDHNVAQSNSVGGGAIRLNGNNATSSLTITNTTITANEATNGAAIQFRGFVGALTINNCTITGNTVNTNGTAGIVRDNTPTTAMTLTLNSSIVAANLNSANAVTDFSFNAGVTMIATNSLVGNTTGVTGSTFNSCQTGTSTSPLAPVLSTLGFHNAGSTPVQVPVTTSPALSNGLNAVGGTDQTGVTRTAPHDIGSVDVPNGVLPIGMVSLPLPRITSPSSTAYTFDVTFYDAAGINSATIAASNYVITRPNGTTSVPDAVVINNTTATTLTATYSFTPPDGTINDTWDGNENGLYAILLNANSVKNTNGIAAAAGLEATFAVTIATPTVTASGAGNISTATTTNNISVTFNDATGFLMNVLTLGANDVRVTGPGFNALASFVTATPNVNSATVTATYSITGPGGTWDDTENGNTYAITLEPNAVANTNAIAVPATSLGTFYVSLPTTYVVTTTANSGTGSLRDRITLANAFADSLDTITFDPTVFSTAQTISLASALPTITAGVTINGPGTSKLTLQRAAGNSTPFSMFTINNGQASAIPVTISGINVIGNETNAVSITAENVTLNDLKISGVTMTGNGGGIYLIGGAVGGTLTLNLSTIVGNSVSGIGGGIAVNSANNSVFVNASSIESNTAASGGGIGIPNTALTTNLSIENSTLFGNSATVAASAFGSPGGGGLLFQGTMGGAGLLIRSSTLSGNTSNYNGGGIAFAGVSGLLAIQNTTITANASKNTSILDGDGGGGIAVVSSGGSPILDIESTILSGNSAANSRNDIATVLANLSFNLNTSAVGTQQPGTGYVAPTGSGNLTVANSSNAALNLGPLQFNYGGLTKTHDIPVGSTAIGKGSNPAGLNLDQNGSLRVQQGGIDIGSVEHRPGPPSAVAGTLASVNTNQPGVNNPYTFIVTYTDETAMNFGSLGNNDLTIVKTGGGFTALATFVGALPATNAPQIEATYQFTPPGSMWGASDNGTYSIIVQANSVLNTIGVPVPTGSLGGIAVNFPTTYAVTNANNSGTGSLRQAIQDANANAGATDLIVFDATFFGSSARTITLTTGELSITDPVTITGPGMSLLTISGNKASRIFKIDSPGVQASTLSDLTLTNGRTTADGGAIFIQDDNVTLTRLTVTGNRAVGNGGGIAFNRGDGSTLLIQNSVISFNTASTPLTSDGGGIAVDSPTGGSQVNVIITESSILNNSAPDDGGGIALASGVSFLMGGSTLARNVAGYNSAAVDGAGIAFSGLVGANGFTIRNSTIVDNTAKALAGTSMVGAGGVGFNDVVGLVRILNSTITGNSTSATTTIPGQSGGGIGMTGANGTLSLISTIISGNLSAGTSPDIASVSPVDSDHCAIGDHNGFSDGTATANLANGLDLKLATLTGNGGGTATRAILPGSPLINAGVNTSTSVPPLGPLANDQRGSGFSRNEAGGVDIGAFERKPGVPLAVPVANVLPDITSKATSFTFTITYTSDDDLNLATINGDEIRITGPNGVSIIATFVGLNPGTSTTTRTATYTFTPPGGFWDPSDNGLYTFVMLPGSVSTFGGSFVSSGAMFAMACAVPLSLVVTNILDSGPGSLRDAVETGNTNAAGTTDIITFSPLFNTVQTITLTTGEIPITDGLILQGPGANLLSVSGNNAGRIFNVDNADATSIIVSISGMTITNGSTAGDGGAIQFANESLNLTEVHVTASTATGSGGGVAASGTGATLNVTRSAVSSNSATTGGSSSGGGIYMIGGLPGGTANILNTTLAKNSAAATGGGFAGSFTGGYGVTLTLDQSTITANTSGGAGGGFRLGSNSAAFATLTNTIVSGNTGSFTAPDISLASVVSSFSAIGSSAGFTQLGSISDLAYGTGLNLGVFGNNGGLTPVVPLLGGSPAIDFGGTTGELTDQRGPGFGRVSNILQDIGAFEVQPAVTGFIVNGGDPQRSRILSVEVTFAADVSAATFQGLGGVQFVRTGLSTIPTGTVGEVVQSGAVAASTGLVNVIQGASNSIVLTFDNTPDISFLPVSSTTMVENTSLADGYWQLKVANYSSPLNSVQLRRLYGDSTATAFGTVDGTDLTAFGNAFNSADVAFDFNNDGTIDGTDLTAFGNRFGNVL